ncbi:hypothetical protein HMN09_00460300 [Mycena chlorophos]|uniref:Uncharacterized protein n=1 Tax=Mycena chlorophos TaxID=658473 RepID=A0A8H6WGX8_MYCCL|nr:hypothetical protein HMN09_00460300 [Mycena chlorophos]
MPRLAPRQPPTYSCPLTNLAGVPLDGESITQPTLDGTVPPSACDYGTTTCAYDLNPGGPAYINAATCPENMVASVFSE